MLNRLLGAAVAAATLTAGFAMPTEAASEQEPVRILIVGDSQTHGSVGDWTWRYRLWNNLADQNVEVDFVGPHDGVLDGDSGDREDMRYADPKFDTDHAARWGMGFADQEYAIGDLIRDYQPDVVVEMLGTVDLAFYHHTPDDIAAAASEFVAAARAADPGVDIVLGHVFDSWVGGSDGANGWIDVIARDRDEADSRVVVAAAPQDYALNVDTYDPLHPSATGEVKIAQSVASALAELGVGSEPDDFPLVSNGPAATPTLTARIRSGVTRLSWTMPAGATGVKLWRREVGAGGWMLVPVKHSYPAPRRAQVVQWRVQAFKGQAVSPFFSNTVRVQRR